MPTLKNSELLGGIIQALYRVTGRRTSERFAATVIGAIVKTLEQNYDFLKYVRMKKNSYLERGYLEGGGVFDVTSDIDSVEPGRVSKAIEAIVRVVYMDLKGKGGLFFIAELKKHVGGTAISELKDRGIDLELMQIEQHYLYRQRKGKKSPSGTGAGTRDKEEEQSDEVSLLGYDWSNVSSWKYDAGTGVFVIYGKDGKLLDKLPVGGIIKNYVGSLSELDDLPEDMEEKFELNEKEYEFLKILHSRDMDADAAAALLHVSKEELDSMIRKLLKIEMLHYVSFNVIELTEIGMNYLSAKEKENVKK